MQNGISGLVLRHSLCTADHVSWLPYFTLKISILNMYGIIFVHLFTSPGCFCILLPPCPMDFLLGYWIELATVDTPPFFFSKSMASTRIFYRGVRCCGFTTPLLHVSPSFENIVISSGVPWSQVTSQKYDLLGMMPMITHAINTQT